MGLTRASLAVLILGCAAILVGSVFGAHFIIFIAYNGAFLVLLAADWLLTPSAKRVSVVRGISGNIELKQKSNITLTVRNDSPFSLKIRVIDTLPEQFDCCREPVSGKIYPHASSCFEYEAEPKVRGKYALEHVHCELDGVLRLCKKRLKLKCSDELHVLPALEAQRRIRLFAEKRQLVNEDQRGHRLFGLGTDFKDLREYSRGDDVRKINWRATARLGKLITNEYDTEKDQSVIIAIDTGRMMLSSAQGLTRLDYALESSMALAQAAVSGGDRVGLIAFGHNIKGFIRPQKGPEQLPRLLKAVFSLRADYLESDLNGLSAYITANHKKRSLVCIFTCIGDEEDSRRILRELMPLKKRHAVMIVSLRNPGLKTTAEKKALSMEDVFMKASASHRLMTQKNASGILRRGGIDNVITEPDKLPTGAVNKYLSMKSRIRI